MKTQIVPRLTQLEIISNAERQQEEFVGDAMRRYYQSEYSRERRQMWIGTAWGLGIVLAITLAVLLILKK